MSTETASLRTKLTPHVIKQLRPRSSPYDVRDEDTPGFLVRVEPSGKKSFFVEYRRKRPDPETHRLRSMQTRRKLGEATTLPLAQARIEASKIRAKVQLGQDPDAERKAAEAEAIRSITLALFLEKHYEPWRSANRRRASQDIHRIRQQFAELLPKALADITPWLVEKWRSQRLKGGAAKGTVNRDVALLKAALSRAVDWDLLPSSPLLKVKPLKVDVLHRVRYLADDEEIRLLKALEERESRMREGRRSGNRWRREREYQELPDYGIHGFVDHLRPCVLLAMNTGMRRGEIFSLRWSSVNWERKHVTVVGAYAKSGKTRHIPLNTIALAILDNWFKQRGKPAGDQLVFPSRLGKQMDNLQSSWTEVLKAARIDDFRFHDLRHHFASKLAMRGIDMVVLRELLGHASMEMTLRYSHLAPEHKAAAVAKLVEGMK